MNYLTYTLSIALSVFLSLGISANIISSSSVITVSIKGVPVSEQQLVSDQYTVSSSGYIKLPLLPNSIKASGISGATLSRKIEAAYKEAQIYNNPLINVITAKDKAGEQIDNKIVSVGGHVKSPGPKPYARGMTLYQAVTAAGGANAFGSIKRVELLRNGKKYTYNLKDVKDMQLKIYPGDTINVPQKTVWGN